MTSTRSCPCALRRGAASPLSAIAIFGTLALLTPTAAAAPGVVDLEPLFAAGRPLEVVHSWAIQKLSIKVADHIQNIEFG